MIDPNLTDRMQQLARDWRVVYEASFETESSVIVFGSRDHESVVLKIVKRPGDEWHSGEILKAFDGQGFARIYEQAPGAVLLERLSPGNSLVDLTSGGRDEEATEILAEVIFQMSARTSSMSARGIPSSCPTVQDWAKGFESYIATGDDQIPIDLVEAGQRVYLNLCASQRQPRLLHGDLQHYNVLFDSGRGWVAIDPKGIVAEIEYEIGAVLRNPVAQPDLFLSTAIIDRRLKQFANRLNLDYERALAWAFAQAVLSAIWTIEDGFVVETSNPDVRLAEVIRPMLGTPDQCQ